MQPYLQLSEEQLKAIGRPPASKVADLIDLHEELLSQHGTGTDPVSASSPAQQNDSIPTSAPGQPPPLWGFRGQPQPFGTLCPSYQRRFKNVKSVTTVERIEKKLVEAFRKHYSNLQGTVANMPNPDQVRIGRDLRCLSVMQHYGVPTRLLDWTSDFWIAVYFACAGDPGHDAELWFYNRVAFQSASQQAARTIGHHMEQYTKSTDDPPLLGIRNHSLLLEIGLQLTPRMREQKAYHTVATAVFADHAPLMYKLLGSESLNPADASALGFFRVVIDRRCKENVLKYLNEDYNMSASSIFPDFEGLGKFLRWHLDSLETTLL